MIVKHKDIDEIIELFQFMKNEFLVVKYQGRQYVPLFIQLKKSFDLKTIKEKIVCKMKFKSTDIIYTDYTVPVNPNLDPYYVIYFRINL